ncbi:MAG TPA: histidine kinase [Candidatus Aquilonibacter sp.]|nr:histidine kinase [Candidatus Aquilonibacter sp.]
MKVISARAAWRLFIAALLILAGFAYMGDRTAQQYASSEAWVSHTREVESQIALLRAEMAAAFSAGYESHADPAALGRYQQASQSVEGTLDALQTLTQDNPVERENLRKLRPAVQERMELIATELSSQAQLTPDQRDQLADESSAAAITTGILQDMRSEEERLLGARTMVSDQSYLRFRMVLAVGVVCMFSVLIFAFRTLLAQLSQKAAAERAVRKLSAHILRVQDSERRRLARELHDGLGQTFAGLNMELEMLSKAANLDPNQRQSFANAQQMAAEGLSQTRTISYLLHPPMLDEFGFEHAAKWFVEGFASRSKIEVDLKISQPFKRLPESVELVMFRVIQEALTNVHRHSGSARAEIVATQHTDRLSLTVRDFGKGIPFDLLKSIEQSAAESGVGLGGMRERVAELGGYFTIDSGPQGTILTVSLPIVEEEQAYADGGPDAQVVAERSRKLTAREKDFGGFPRVAIEM